MNLTTLGWDGDWAATLADLETQDLAPWRVLAVHRGRLAVRGEHGDALLPLAGRLRAAAETAADLPAVGDWVAARPDGAVEHRLARRTLLARTDPTTGATEALAANAQLCLVASSLNRDLNPRRAERLAAMAFGGGLEPLVVCTKADLVAEPELAAARLSRTTGLEATTISAHDGWGLDELAARIAQAGTAVLVGSSGVGKSTLVNALLRETRQATREIRPGDDRGRHATVHRELFPLPGGGLLIDTPGVRLAAAAADADGTADAFADVHALAAGCRFGDCAHAGEPGCAVQAAIADGRLDRARLEAMRKLGREALSAQERRERSRTFQRLHRYEIRARTRRA